MKQYDWLRNEFFISWGLQCGQDFSDGELQHGWKIDMIANMLGSALKVKTRNHVSA